MNFERLITSVPINRTAAVVAKGSNAEDVQTPLQRRQNLIRLTQQIDAALKTTVDPERRKWLGQKKFEFQELLRTLPRKALRGHSDLANFIVDVAREQISKPVFHQIMNEAQRRYIAAQQGGEDELVG